MAREQSEIPGLLGFDPSGAQWRWAALDTFPFLNTVQLTESAHSSSLRRETWFGMPDISGVLRDGSIARESARGGDVQNCFVRPDFLIGIEFRQANMSFGIAFEIGKMEVIISVP